MEEPFNPDAIRRCRPLLRRSQQHEIDPVQLLLMFHRNRLLLVESGLVSYRLVRYVLQEPMLTALVDAGDAIVVVDPDTGQSVYDLAGGV